MLGPTSVVVPRFLGRTGDALNAFELLRSLAGVLDEAFRASVDAAPDDVRIVLDRGLREDAELSDAAAALDELLFLAQVRCVAVARAGRRGRRGGRVGRRCRTDRGRS